MHPHPHPLARLWMKRTSRWQRDWGGFIWRWSLTRPHPPSPALQQPDVLDAGGGKPPESVGGPLDLDALVGEVMRRVGFMFEARLAPYKDMLPPDKSFRPPLNVKPRGGETRLLSLPPWLCRRIMP